MNNKLILIVIFVILATNIVLSDNITEDMYGLNIGTSKLVGDGSKYYKIGFDINGYLLQKVSEDMYLGLRASYNRWSPNEDEIEDEFDIPGLDIDISGSASIIEIIPTIRIVPAFLRTGQTQFYGQLGAGYYKLYMDTEIYGSLMGYSSTSSIDESKSNFGIDFGPGVIINITKNTKITLSSMYKIIYGEKESTNYFTINLGILFDAAYPKIH